MDNFFQITVIDFVVALELAVLLWVSTLSAEWSDPVMAVIIVGESISWGFSSRSSLNECF